MRFCKECQINEAAHHKNYCHKCRSKIWRTNNPAAYLWHNLKKSAKKRGLLFTITQKEFVAFISQTEYMHKRGRLSDSLTIDRVDGRVGYHLSNIQILTKSENSSKFHDKVREYGDIVVDDKKEEYPF